MIQSHYTFALTDAETVCLPSGDESFFTKEAKTKVLFQYKQFSTPSDVSHFAE